MGKRLKWATTRPAILRHALSRSRPSRPLLSTMQHDATMRRGCRGLAAAEPIETQERRFSADRVRYLGRLGDDGERVVGWQSMWMDCFVRFGNDVHRGHARPWSLLMFETTTARRFEARPGILFCYLDGIDLSCVGSAGRGLSKRPKEGRQPRYARRRSSLGRSRPIRSK